MVARAVVRNSQGALTAAAIGIRAAPWVTARPQVCTCADACAHVVGLERKQVLQRRIARRSLIIASASGPCSVLGLATAHESPRAFWRPPATSTLHHVAVRGLSVEGLLQAPGLIGFLVQLSAMRCRTMSCDALFQMLVRSGGGNETSCGSAQEAETSGRPLLVSRLKAISCGIGLRRICGWGGRRPSPFRFMQYEGAIGAGQPAVTLAVAPGLRALAVPDGVIASTRSPRGPGGRWTWTAKAPQSLDAKPLALSSDLRAAGAFIANVFELGS